MRADPGTVAPVVGADVAVIGAGRAGRDEAVGSRLVASGGALGTDGAGVAGMHATEPAAAAIGAVAEHAVVAGILVRDMGAAIGTRARVVGLAAVGRAGVPVVAVPGTELQVVDDALLVEAHTIVPPREERDAPPSVGG